MFSHEHAALGAVAGAVLLVAVVPPLPTEAALALWAAGVAASVAIDLDHFLLARVLTGDWRHARRVLGDPGALAGDQAWVFADVADRLRGTRLASHLVVAGVLSVAAWVAWPPLAAFVAGVLAVHVAADILRDAGLA